MKYVGSKRRIAKEILAVMLKNRTTFQWYVEPFVGGCNSIADVTGYRIGADINPYLIAMWSAFQQGWIPPNEINEDLYNKVKENKANYPMELVAFIGIACTFGSKWYKGYARNKRGVNYAMEGRENLLKQIEKIKTVKFIYSAYNKLEIPANSIIYCDIPYQNTTDGYIEKFDYLKFWQWCREKTLEGHQVFISEYQAPDDFKCVWQAELKSNLDASIMKTTTEKLFIYQP